MKTNYEPWRGLPMQTAPALWQLAIGDALLAGLPVTGVPAVCWYRVPSPALVIGRGQPVQHINQDVCRAAGLPLYRRSSGGTAVLMTTDFLMLDIALPPEHRLFTSDVTEAYRWLGEVWVYALARVGVQARLISVADARDETRTCDPLVQRVCFGSVSPYEVLVGNQKLVGLSQIRRRQGVLLQAGIYTHWHPALLADVCAPTPAERPHLHQLLLARATGLHDCAPAAEDHHTLMAAFAAALREKQGVVLAPAAWLAVEHTTRAQRASQYADNES